VSVLKIRNAADTGWIEIAGAGAGDMFQSEYDPDANGIIAIAEGGTNASTVSGARTNLGLAIGSNVQAWDTDLDWVAANITAAGKALLDDADAAAQRTTLGLAIGANVQAWDTDLDWVAANITAAGKALLDDADATAQRTTLGLVIGTNVQAYDATLSTLAGGLASAKIWIGGAGGEPAQQSISGDASLADTGALTVVGLQTTSIVSPLSPTDGQVLAWSTANSRWQPGSVATNLDALADGATYLRLAGVNASHLATASSLDLTMSPTWTGSHTFDKRLTIKASGTFKTGLSIDTKSVDTGVSPVIEAERSGLATNDYIGGLNSYVETAGTSLSGGYGIRSNLLVGGTNPGGEHLSIGAILDLNASSTNSAYGGNAIWLITRSPAVASTYYAALATEINVTERFADRGHKDAWGQDQQTVGILLVPEAYLSGKVFPSTAGLVFDRSGALGGAYATWHTGIRFDQDCVTPYNEGTNPYSEAIYIRGGSIADYRYGLAIRVRDHFNRGIDLHEATFALDTAIWLPANKCIRFGGSEWSAIWGADDRIMVRPAQTEVGYFFASSVQFTQDVQIDANKKYIMNRGTNNTYMVFNSTNSHIEFWIAGVLEGYIDGTGFHSV